MDRPMAWDTAPFDAVTWALAKKNRRAARALLEKRGALTWLEGARYAPWTLGWAPELLELILDRLPPRDEELYCLRRFFRPGGDWYVGVCSSLLTAAAALDDLPAVELLLARGCVLNEHELDRNFMLSPHHKDLAAFRADSQFPHFHHMTKLYLHSLSPSADAHSPSTRIPPSLDMPGPLSAAIFCGADRCTVRLLEALHDAPLSLSVRHALISAHSRRCPTVQTVSRILGKELDELLDPEDFLDRKDPLFFSCLKRKGAMQEHFFLIRYLVSSVQKDSDSLNALRYVDSPAISNAILSQLDTLERKDIQLLRTLPGLELVLDRNAVPPELRFDILREYLEHAQVVGEPPEGEISGLALALLRDIEGARPASYLHDTRTLSILLQEDPEALAAYLRRQASTPTHALLLALLNTKEEEAYDL